jgi:hypothetical protein
LIADVDVDVIDIDAELGNDEPLNRLEWKG